MRLATYPEAVVWKKRIVQSLSDRDATCSINKDHLLVTLHVPQMTEGIRRSIKGLIEDETGVKAEEIFTRELPNDAHSLIMTLCVPVRLLT